jgi:hypothetical protein
VATPPAPLHAPGDRVHRLRDRCRACGASRLERFLELGPQPLANSFLRDPAEFAGEPRFPLDVYFCERCGLVQLLDVIDPEVLFRNYVYVTGTSATMAAHNARYAKTLVSLLDADRSDLIVEVASNDGSLLSCFRDHGVRTLGIEPARNIAAIARGRGIETVEHFFDRDVAERVRTSHGPARAVIANNVLAHVDDTLGFLRSCRALVRDDGIVVVEVPYVREMLERLEYDTVYHEHLCYFSVGSLLRLFGEAGLRVIRVDRVPVHGGSVRVYATSDVQLEEHARGVLAMAEEERDHGIASLDRWRRFAADVAANRRMLREILESFVRVGRTVVGYGAPAKGNTLLNYCGIGPALLPYTVDRNPLKVGRYTPGMHIPVLPVETIEARRPDCVMILAWNFADEIMSQLASHRERGGRFIVPIPHPTVIS